MSHLPAILADVTKVVCRFCGQVPGAPCVPDGCVHAARVRDARTLSRISEEDVLTVLRAIGSTPDDGMLISPDASAPGQPDPEDDTDWVHSPAWTAHHDEIDGFQMGEQHAEALEENGDRS